jgi:hypothetical protein
MAGLVSLRHYTISAAPSGVKKSLKALLSKRELPDLSGCTDVAEFITKSGYGSVSHRRWVWWWWCWPGGACGGCDLVHQQEWVRLGDSMQRRSCAWRLWNGGFDHPTVFSFSGWWLYKPCANGRGTAWHCS